MNKSIKKRLTTSWSAVRRDHKNVSDKDDPEDKFKGPLGLHLLHASSEPLVDLIFVHGLKGDSVKTWRKGGDPSCFWPQLWLPEEPDFKHANIHTYGYDSNWVSRKSSIIDILDFGRGLLEEMRNAPTLKDDSKRPIVMIGHSMGGLVIKNAFNLAQKTADFKTRIQSVFFLSTPHQGNDFAATLNNILSVSGFWSSRKYLDDITSGSNALQQINEDFSRTAYDLQIFSFYETIKTTYGPSTTLVVGRESAVLGDEFPNERAQYMDADHRTICKFSSVDDPNYIRVRNALETAVRALLNDASLRKSREKSQQMRTLETYLSTHKVQDEHHLKSSGVCQWLDSRDDFQQWRGQAPYLNEGSNISTFWIHSKPGTGKTILAESVVSQLKESHMDCVHHFFKIGDKQSGSVGGFLRSTAYQMARSNALVRERLLRLKNEGSSFNMNDAQGVWASLFKEEIFQVGVNAPQFWVLDALDECEDYQKIFSMLKGAQPKFPLRIFMTSRRLHDMDKLVKILRPHLNSTCLELPLQTITVDIKRYIESRVDDLSIDDPIKRKELGHKILTKSDGSFLWVRLVLDELDTVYTDHSMTEILEAIPVGMEALYKRMIYGLAANTREKHITKTILEWVVVCTRKLTLVELLQALKLDIDTVLPSAGKAVEGLCGQFVRVDKDTGVVDLIHTTAREFLFSCGGEFEVSWNPTHKRVARVCMELLSSQELRPPRHSLALSLPRPPLSPLQDYAIRHFSDHLASISQHLDSLVPCVEHFLNTNALSWLEQLVLKGDLHLIIRASENLRTFTVIHFYQPHNPPRLPNNINQWTEDLEKIVSVFGESLLQEPWCIYFVIPPLCPPESAIFQTYGHIIGSILLDGRPDTNWSPCIASVNFDDDTPVSISCGGGLIAVAMEMNSVNIYDDYSCQKRMSLCQNHPIDLVHVFDGHLVICTVRSVVLYDREGNVVWEKKFHFRFLFLSSTDNLVIAVSQHGRLLAWDKESGEIMIDKEFPHPDEQDGVKAGSLVAVAISPRLQVISLGYKPRYDRGGEICIWDIEAMKPLSVARRESGCGPAFLLFKPDPHSNVLLIGYDDGRLCLHEFWSGKLMHAYNAPLQSIPVSASCSRDGCTLAIADSGGGIGIWLFDFSTLQLRSYLDSSIFYRKAAIAIRLMPNDRLAVIDSSGLRLWSLGALRMKRARESSKMAISTDQPICDSDLSKRHIRKSIGALFSHPTLDVVLSVHPNTGVQALGVSDNLPMTSLNSTKIASRILILETSKHNIIATHDISGACNVKRLSPTGMEVENVLAEIKDVSLAKQMRFSNNGGYLLVACPGCDYIYRVLDGLLVGRWNYPDGERTGAWHWLAASETAGGDQSFSLLADGVMRSYAVGESPELVEGSEVLLDLQDLRCIHSADMHPDTPTLILVGSGRLQALTNPTRVLLFDLSKANLGTHSDDELSPILPIHTKQHWRLFLGFTKARKDLVFLDKDSWVVSTTVADLYKDQSYIRHFFIPEQHFRGEWTERPVVKTADDNFVFILEGELVTIRDGLKSGVRKYFE